MYDFLNGITADHFHKRGFRPDVTGDGEFYTVKDVDFSELVAEGKAVINEREAYVIDRNGNKVPVYFYKRSYFFYFNGVDRKQPKFHIRKCSTVNDFGEHAFMASNTERAKVLNRNGKMGERGYLLELSMCNNCRNGVTEINASTTEEFHEYLKKRYNKEMAKETQVRTDLDGYPLDWSKISQKYRKLKKYTCERCKIGLSNDRRFLHVHHSNGIKTDCQPENLECLCILCHSYEHSDHTSKFEEADTKEEIERFILKYKSKLNKRKHPGF